MKVGKNHEIGRSTAILGAAALLALAIVLTWGDAETKLWVKEWLGWGWAAGASLLGPLVRRRVAEASDAPEVRRRAVAYGMRRAVREMGGTHVTAPEIRDVLDVADAIEAGEIEDEAGCRTEDSRA